MIIKPELLKSFIADYINNRIDNFEIVEEIVCVLEKYKIDIGNRHDF